MALSRFIESDISGLLFRLIFHSTVYRTCTVISLASTHYSSFIFILRNPFRPVYRNSLFSSISRNDDIIDREGRKGVHRRPTDLSGFVAIRHPHPPSVLNVFNASQILPRDRFSFSVERTLSPPSVMYTHTRLTLHCTSSLPLLSSRFLNLDKGSRTVYKAIRHNPSSSPS